MKLTLALLFAPLLAPSLALSSGTTAHAASGALPTLLSRCADLKNPSFQTSANISLFLTDADSVLLVRVDNDGIINALTGKIDSNHTLVTLDDNDGTTHDLQIKIKVTSTEGEGEFMLDGVHYTCGD